MAGRAISYVRFSTPKQALGDSLRRQLERTRDYCDKHGLILDETLTDEGLSGYKGEHISHGALGTFLAAVQAGRVARGTTLIIEHLDRFSRQDTRVALTMLLNVINAGIKIVTLFNGQEYSDTSEKIEHDLIGAILYMSEANKASARKADLLKQTWHGHRKQVASGQRKKLTGMCPAWLDVIDDGFVANKKAKRIIERIFEDVAGGESAYSVCRRLNEESVPALTGNKTRNGVSVGRGWNSARISEIIRSDAVLGWFQPHTRDGNKRTPCGEPLKDYYPAIVSQILVDRARYQLNKRSFGGEGSGRTGIDVANLFTGLFRCALCGGPMYMYHRGRIGASKGRKARWHGGYMRCSRRVAKLGCANEATIPYEHFERMMIENIGGFGLPEPNTTDDPTNELSERLAEAKTESAKVMEAVRMWTDPSAPKAGALMLVRIAELEDQYAKLAVEIDNLTKQIELEKGRLQPSDAIVEVQRIMLEGLNSTDPQKRMVARTKMAAGFKQFISHIVCFPSRSVIVEYDIGGVMCMIRVRLHNDGYKIFHTDWDYGSNKGKPALTLPVQDRFLELDERLAKAA